MENKFNTTRILAVLMFFMLFGCNYSEDEVSVDEVILAMTATPESIIADGKAKATITIQLPDNALETKRSISLNTTKGLFEIENKNVATVSAVNVSENGVNAVKASASIISATEEGFATVKATVGNYSKTVTINFTRSYPDYFTIGVDRLNYLPNATNEVTVTVQLSKLPGNGSISLGQEIILNAYNTSGQIIGQWRNKNTIVDSTGKCINYFSLPLGSTYVDPITFTATASTSATQQSDQSATINIIQ